MNRAIRQRCAAALAESEKKNQKPVAVTKTSKKKAGKKTSKKK